MAAVPGVTLKSSVPLTGGAPRPGYAGPDRRGVVARSIEHGTVIWLTLALGAVVWFAVYWLDHVTGSGEVYAPRISRSVSALAAALAVATGVLSIARWRLVGDAAAFAAGLAMAVLGVFTVGLPDVIAPLVTAEPDPTLLAFSPAGVVTAIGVLLGGLRLPPVDTRLRLFRSSLATAASVAAIAAMLQLLPGLVINLTTSTSRGEHAVVALLWAVLALAFARDAHENEREVSLWLFGLLLCLGQSRLARLLAVSLGATWEVGARMFTLLGFLVAYSGAVRIAQDTARRQQLRMLESLVTAKAAVAVRDAERAARAELDHDLRSALMAIDGAASTLEHHFDRLAPTDRTFLVSSLSSEINRIQGLISRSRSGASLFSVADLARRLARCDEARGATVAVEIPDDLFAIGSCDQTAEILRNLLDNAYLHGRGREVCIRGEHGDRQVLLSVEDAGPGLPAGATEVVFQRGWSSRATDDVDTTGLGLFVARRLAHDQGGGLWARNRPGGGAAFVLSLPAPEIEKEHE